MDKLINYVTSPQAFISVLVLLGAVALWALLKRALRLLAARGDGDNAKKEHLARSISTTVKYILAVLAVLTVLQINGINVSSMVAGLGLASAVVGLALQDLLKDAIMGMHIVTDHFYAVGDVVSYNGIEGVVVDFTAKTTKLRCLDDNSILSICNRNISEIRKLSNFSILDVPLSYQEDAHRVRQVLEELCIRIRQVEDVEDCLYKGAGSFGDSAVIYKIFLYCPPEKKYALRRAALQILQEGLQEAGLSIPYNRLDVCSVPQS